MKVIFILLFTIHCLPFTASAQPQNNLDIARQYESTGEFDKAVIYYEKQYDADPFGTYDAYMNCLLQLKDYPKAEKLIKKQMKKNVGQAKFLVELGRLYELQNQNDKAKKHYENAVKSLLPDVGDVITTANEFGESRNLDFAIETYLAGRKLMNGSYPFSFELAEMYSQKGETQKMIDEYMEMIAYNPQYMANVQAIMQNKIANDLSGTLSQQLRTVILRKIQKNPDELSYSEFLYWLCLQEKDFESALIQAKSLDKKTSNDGSRVLALAELCIANKEWSTAESCCKYIIEKDKNSALYARARILQVRAMSARITGGLYTKDDLIALDNNYKKTIEEIGTNSITVQLLQDYAHFNAFYFDKADTAIVLLEQAIEIPNVSPELIAGCKLELGDILILKNQLWDASLYYSQVDKDFKHDAIGREAKFRNARLSYYLGEFDWAKAQLNILQQATSQLISNDAMQLGLLITDNVGEDSITEPLRIYSRAELLAFQNKNEPALATLDSILFLYPGRKIADEIWFKKATIFIKQNKLPEAIKNLEDVIANYAEDVLADDALFLLAQLNENQLNNKPKAMELYQQLIEKHPSSLYVSDARKKFRELRGDKMN